MTFTRHLKHIPGTTIEDEEGRVIRRVIDCGGPGSCLDCTTDELDAFKLGPVFNKKEGRR